MVFATTEGFHTLQIPMTRFYQMYSQPDRFQWQQELNKGFQLSRFQGHKNRNFVKDDSSFNLAMTIPSV